MIRNVDEYRAQEAAKALESAEKAQTAPAVDADTPDEEIVVSGADKPEEDSE